MKIVCIREKLRKLHTGYLSQIEERRASEIRVQNQLNFKVHFAETKTEERRNCWRVEEKNSHEL